MSYLRSSVIIYLRPRYRRVRPDGGKMKDCYVKTQKMRYIYSFKFQIERYIQCANIAF